MGRLSHQRSVPQTDLPSVAQQGKAGALDPCLVELVKAIARDCARAYDEEEHRQNIKSSPSSTGGGSGDLV